MRKFGNRYYANIGKAHHNNAVRTANIIRQRGFNARVIRGKNGSSVFIAPRRFNFQRHKMYDPATGKSYVAEKKEDHERMSKMGYTHTPPKTYNATAKISRREYFDTDPQEGTDEDIESRSFRMNQILEEYDGDLSNWGRDLISKKDKERWNEQNKTAIEEARRNRSEYAQRYDEIVKQMREDFAEMGIDLDAPSRVRLEDRSVALKKLTMAQSQDEKKRFEENLQKARISMGEKAAGYLMLDYAMAELYRRANLLTYGTEGGPYNPISDAGLFKGVKDGEPVYYSPMELNSNLALDPSSGAQSVKRFKLGGKKVNYHLFALGYNKKRLQEVSNDLKAAGFSARVVSTTYDKPSALKRWAIFIHPTGKNKTEGLKRLYEDQPNNPQFGNVMRSLLSAKGLGLGTWDEDGTKRGFDIAYTDPRFIYSGSNNDYENIYGLDWVDFEDIYNESKDNDFIVLKDKLYRGFGGKSWQFIREQRDSMTPRWASKINPGPMALNVRVYGHSEKPISVAFMDSEKSDKKMKAVFTYADGHQKTTHFGGKGYSDFTIHKDPKRKQRYLDRHERNEDWGDPTSAGALSRWVLWNKKSKTASIEDYKRRFDLMG